MLISNVAYQHSADRLVGADKSHDHCTSLKRFQGSDCIQNRMAMAILSLPRKAFHFSLLFHPFVRINYSSFFPSYSKIFYDQNR